MKSRTVVWVLGVVSAVVLSASAFTVGANSRFNLKRPGGSYRVVIELGKDKLPFLATFGSDGTIVTTFVPLTCLGPEESSSPAHGSWDLVFTPTGPALQMRLLADTYSRKVVKLGEQDQAQQNVAFYVGQTEIVGQAQLGLGAIEGKARVRFQGSCSNHSGDVVFTATPIASESPDKDEPK